MTRNTPDVTCDIDGDKINSLHPHHEKCPYRTGWTCKVEVHWELITFAERLKICNNCLLSSIAYSIYKSEGRYSP